MQENTKANMEKMEAFQGDKAQFLPKKTYKDKLSLGKGKDQIDLYYFGPGHTNGDTFVVFPALRVMHAGDMFARKGTPFIDARNGGSGAGYHKTLAKAVSGVKKVETVITGHSPLMTWNDFKEFAALPQGPLHLGQGAAQGGQDGRRGGRRLRASGEICGLHRAQGRRLRHLQERRAGDVRRSEPEEVGGGGSHPYPLPQTGEGEQSAVPPRRASQAADGADGRPPPQTPPPAARSPSPVCGRGWG